MYLINCSTLELEEFTGRRVPSYAILSHTWETHELRFKDYCCLNELKTRRASEKIISTCALALSEGYAYVWIDTCCIDKSSSSELSEAINSMFKWYRRSARCYVYLSDFDSTSPSADFGRCRWFTRGWTLQELIAPRDVRFYDSKWRYFGSKQDLAPSISAITGIALDVISSGRFSPNSHTVAERMSWAANRETTREEDLAYCLFGLFDVNLPLLYGEGPKAFMRLQEEIITKSADLTIFAWTAEIQPSFRRGILARSPDEFAHARGMQTWDLTINPEFKMTNKGLKIRTRFRRFFDGLIFMPLGCRQSEEPTGLHMGIWLRQATGYLYRVRAHELGTSDDSGEWKSGLTYIIRDVEIYEA